MKTEVFIRVDCEMFHFARWNRPVAVALVYDYEAVDGPG